MSFIFHPFADPPMVLGPDDLPTQTAQSTFGLYGSAGFAPFYAPIRFSVGKERNLDRSEGFCGGEDVSDLGSKNRELHIAGFMRESEITSFGELLDSNATHDIVTPGWSGEVRVLDGEYEGPRSFDPFSGEDLYKYSLNVVSTGRDEYAGFSTDDGIIRGG